MFVLRAMSHLFVRSLPEATVLPILTGPLRGARWIVRSSNIGCWAGVFERENQQRLTRLLRPGDRFVDVGANVGFFTLLGARRVGSGGGVLAFEPLEANLTLLRRHVELNGASQVSVFATALADRPGRGAFLHRGSPSQARLDPRGGTIVEIETLDIALERKGWDSVHAIKIDVEGAEARVLRGARRTIATERPPALLVATHGWQAHEDCLRELSSCGAPVTAETIDERSGNGSILSMAAD